MSELSRFLTCFSVFQWQDGEDEAGEGGAEEEIEYTDSEDDGLYDFFCAISRFQI